MSEIYTKGDYDTPRATKDSWIEYPFIEEGDSATKIYHMICEVNRSGYDATAVDLDDTMASAAAADVVALPFATDSSAYFVGDFDHQAIEGGLIRFDRQFAKIPATRNGSFSGTVAYTYPGIESKDTNGTERTITAASTTGNVTTLTATNTVSVGDVIFFTLTTTGGGVTITVSDYTTALAGTTGSVVKIPSVAVLGTFDSGTLTELLVAPGPQKTIPTGSITDYTYYLPGVTSGITVPGDVEESTIFAPMSARTGRSVNTLADDTVPDSATYAAQITNRDYIIIESNVTRWKGNIIQRANVKVRAL